MEKRFNNEEERDYFINKVKGALMYRGGSETFNFESTSAWDFINSCFTNNIFLDCSLDNERFKKIANEWFIKQGKI